MADVVNLNQFRKRKAREAKEREAEANRRKHGRTKAEKVAEQAERDALQRMVEGALRERPAPSDDEPAEEPAEDPGTESEDP